MSNTNEASQPLVTFGRVMPIDPVSVFGFLALSGIVFAYIAEYTEAWTLSPVWGFAPAAVYLAWTIVWGTSKVRQEKVRSNKSAENVSDYLARNYSLSVSPKACLKYCEDYSSLHSESVIPAEDLSTGEKARVVLHFSSDLSSVTPMRLEPVK